MTKTLRILFLYNGIFVFGASLLGPLYAIFVEEIGADPLAISLTWAAFLVSTVFFLYVLTRIGDRLANRRTLLLSGMIVRVVVWLLFAFAGSIYAVVALQVLLGLGEALGTPAFDAITAEHLGAKGHIRAYADWHIIAKLTTAFGVIMGGVIVSAFGFVPLFFTMAAVSLVAFLGLLIQPKELMDEPAEKP